LFYEIPFTQKIHLREIFFFFLADLRGFSLRPSAYLQSAPICVKSSFSLADLRGFYLRLSAYLQSASICVKQSFLFSLIYADFICAHLRIFNLRPSA